MAKALEQMTDEELNALLSESEKKPLEKMTDEELDALLAEPKEPGYSDLAKETAIGGVKAIGGALETAGKVMDYPFAPARELLGTSIESLLGKRQPSEIFERTTTPLFEGPSKGRSWSEILKDLGVPEVSGPAVPVGIEQLMTEEEKAAAPQFMPATVGGAFLEQLTPSTIGKAISKIPTPSFSRTEMMAKAIGLPSEEIDIATKKIPESLKSLETLSEYAKESGVVKPLSTLKDIRDSAQAKVNEAGSKIGEIIDNASDKINNWLEKAPRAEREAYLKSGFNTQILGPKMLKEIYNEYKGGNVTKRSQAMRELTKWLDEHNMAETYRPFLGEMQQWKKNIQDSIKDFEQIGAQQPGKQAAYRKILDYLNKGIEAELNFSEKFLKNSPNLEEYRKLKREYYLANKIYDSSSAKLSKQIAGELPPPPTTLGMVKDMVVGPRVASTLAVTPEVSLIPSKLTPAMQFRAGYVSTSPEYQQAEQNITRALMMGIPPFILDKQVQLSPLKPTEQAPLRKKITREGTT